MSSDSSAISPIEGSVYLPHEIKCKVLVNREPLIGQPDVFVMITMIIAHKRREKASHNFLMGLDDAKNFLNTLAQTLDKYLSADTM